MKQRTAEWFAARLGCVTASRVADVLAATRKGPSAARTTYLYQLVAERLTGLPTEHYVTADMQRGIDQEATARTLYELREGLLVREMGFCFHPSIPMCGASPDGMVGHDLLIEIKCPRPHRHVATLLTQTAPEEYVPQMMLQMACTGAAACDFVSYCDAMPEAQQLVVVRVQRDADYVVQMERAIEEFLREVDAAVEQALKATA